MWWTCLVFRKLRSLGVRSEVRTPDFKWKNAVRKPLFGGGQKHIFGTILGVVNIRGMDYWLLLITDCSCFQLWMNSTSAGCRFQWNTPAEHVGLFKKGVSVTVAVGRNWLAPMVIRCYKWWSEMHYFKKKLTHIYTYLHLCTCLQVWYFVMGLESLGLNTGSTGPVCCW